MDKNKLTNKDSVVNSNKTGEGFNKTKVIPVIEEQIVTDKKVVETGKVRISKQVTEHDELVDVPLIADEVHVERVPVNQYVQSPPPPVRYEGNTMIIPVLKEVLVVEKRLVVVEELHITKRIVERNEQQEVRLRKEEVNVIRDEIHPEDTVQHKDFKKDEDNDNEVPYKHLI